MVKKLCTSNTRLHFRGVTLPYYCMCMSVLLEHITLQKKLDLFQLFALFWHNSL